MAFARSLDHLDSDPISLAALLAPRPAVSFVHHVRDRNFEAEGIYPGDILIVERGRPLRAGQIVLAAVDGESRLVRVAWRTGGVTFADAPSDMTIEHLATVSRVLRILLP